MGELIRTKDWLQTSLGAIKEWPQNLRLTLDICLNSSPSACIFWGKELISLYNDTWKEMLGDRHPSVLGCPAREVFKDNQQIIATLNQVISTGEAAEVKSHQFSLSKSSDEKHYFDFSFTPISGENAPAGIFCTATNVTEKVQAQKRKEHLEEALTIETAGVVFFTLGGNIIDANSAFLRMSGYNQQDLDAGLMRWDDMTPPEFMSTTQNALRELEKTGRTKPYEKEYYRKDGSRWCGLFSSHLLEDGSAVEFVLDITERKATEKQLQRSERELADFFENATVGLHWLDPNGKIIRVNQAELDMLGYSREEYIGHHISEFYVSKEIIDDVLKRLANAEGLNDLEAQLKCKDGSVRDVIISSNIFREDGKFIHTCCFTRDITERKKATQALRKSEEKYRTLFESIDEGFFIIKMLDGQNEPIDFRYLEVNPAFVKHTELKNAEGKTMRELAPALEEHWFEPYKKVALTGKPIRFEKPVENDGEYLWFDVFAFRFGNAEERKVAVLFDDITDRKKMEEALRDSEKRLRSALDIETVGVIFWGKDFTITEVNDAFLRMSGFTREEAVGLSWQKLTPKEFYQKSKKAVSEIRSIGKTDPYEKQYIRKDGSRWWGLFAPRRLDEDEVVEYVLDITERKQAEEVLHQNEGQLRDLNETLEERVEKRTAALISYQNQLRTLASKLSKAEESERHRLASELHDNLGQMLAVSKMRLDLVQKDELPNQTATEIGEISGLVDEALVYTRELMSDLKPPPSIDQAEIGTVMDWLAEKMKKHDLNVIIENDEQPKPLSTEIRTIIIQCVRELLFNVVKHSGANEARLILARTGNEVQITVEDKGKGFNPKNLVKGLTEEGGFGLFNIRERVDLFGGRFDVVSEPGKGTKITLNAPLEEKEAFDTNNGSKKSKKSSKDTKPKKKVKVLLADDHEMMREGLRRIVDEEDDLTVIAEASDGEEAVKLAHETIPDVIVMDVNMPGMNGIDATKKITSEIPNMRVVGLSLHDHEHVIESMHNAGASVYLTKNEAFETLCATIRSEAALTKE